MHWGSIFYFRFYVYSRLFLGFIKRATIPVVITIIISTVATIVIYFGPTAFASSEKPITPVLVSAEEQQPVKKLVQQSNPIPKSRMTKSNQKIFVSNYTENKSYPDKNITTDLPILMYHKTPGNFETQLQHLIANGYSAITMRTASRILRGIEPAPAKPVVITFDDGFSDQLVAFEILKKYQLSATFYVMPGGDLSQWCVGAERNNLSCGDSYLNWEEIRMLSKSGLIEIGSHTIDHAQLNSLNTASKHSQIFDAKNKIEQQIGQEVASFAYPYGAFDAEAINMVREAGYTSAVSTIAGTTQSTDTLFELRRIHNAFTLN